jgi:sugar (pentulose or hexulose) kinase
MRRCLALADRSPRAAGDDELRVALIGLSRYHGWAHLARAILEGITLGVRNIARVVANVAGRVRDLRGCGGTPRDELLSGITAALLVDIRSRTVR